MANKITKFRLANNQTYSINDGSAVHFDVAQDLTTSQKTQARANIGASDGNYNNLTNKPTIPSKTSQLINDSNYVTTTYVDNKTAGLTGAMHFKGVVTSLPEVTNYNAGDVIIYGTKEYVCDKDNNKWVELGDEGSHVLNTQKINGHALTGDITLTSSDVGADATGTAKGLINNLNVSSVGGSGKYISAISESAGKISATAAIMPTSLKNPSSLSFGSKTYDGSAATTLALSDLGGATIAQVTAATSKSYSVTLAASSWTASGSVYIYTYSNTVLRASVSPVVSCAENATEYAYITNAEATGGTGIVFTASKKPTANIILTIVDVG